MEERADTSQGWHARHRAHCASFLRYLHREGIVATDLVRSIALSGLEPAHISGFMEERAKTLHKAPRAHCASFCGICIEKASWLRILYVVCRAAVSTAKHLFHAQSGGRMSSGYWPALTVGPSWQAQLRHSDVIGQLWVARQEIAALCLDDFDWTNAQISIPMRKGHSTRYPLSATVGDAVISYLEVRRSDVPHRQVFLTARSPYIPMHHWTVSSMVGGHARYRHPSNAGGLTRCAMPAYSTLWRPTCPSRSLVTT